MYADKKRTKADEGSRNHRITATVYEKSEVAGGKFKNMMIVFFSYVFTDIGDDSSYIYKWNKNLE